MLPWSDPAPDAKQNQLAAHAGFSAPAASITPLHAVATGEK